MNDWADDILDGTAEAQPDDRQESCPVCGAAAHIKLISCASFWVSCDRCGDYDITCDCRQMLCGDQDALLEELGTAGGAGTTPVGDLRRKLQRYLEETRQVDGRVVSRGPLQRLPEGTSVVIALSDAAQMYEPTSDFEADYQRALEAWRVAGQQLGYKMLRGTECHVFPFDDAIYCQALLGEMVMRGAAAHTLDGDAHCLTHEGRRPAASPDPVCAQEPVASPAPGASPPSDENIMRKGRTTWELRFQGGEVIHIHHLQGLAYIHQLVRQRGKPIHCDELFRLVNPPPSQQAELADDDLATFSSQPQGTQLGVEFGDDDPGLAGVYRQGLDELEAKKARAIRRNDRPGMESLSKQIADLKKAMSNMYGRGGKSRDKLDPYKKQRQAVSDGIRKALKELNTDCPGLAQHLRASLWLGTNLLYAPTDNVDWIT